MSNPEPDSIMPDARNGSPRQRIREAGALALGCWAFGGTGWGVQDDRDSRMAMEAAWDRGVRHLDTALAYGAGHSERLCGAFLEGRRDRAYLATKGMPGLEPDSIVGALETSLSNLGTDYIDLYYLHWPRRGLDLRPFMERLESARERGLIGGIGVSNFGPAEMDRVREVGTIDVHQLCYNVLWRRGERDVIPYCARHGIAMASYSSLAQGILAGRFGPEPSFAPGDARATTVPFEPDVWPFLHQATTELADVAADAGRSIQHLAIQWIREQGHITAIIVGARNGRQAADNVAALEDRLSPQILERINRISERIRDGLPDVDNIFRYHP